MVKPAISMRMRAKLRKKILVLEKRSLLSWPKSWRTNLFPSSLHVVCIDKGIIIIDYVDID